MASDYQKRLEYEALLKKNADDLNEAEKERLELLDAHFERLDRINSKSEDLASSLAKQLKYTGQQAEAFKKVVNSFQPLNEKASDLYDVVTSLKDPLSAGFKLIELSAKRFIELDNAGKAFRETTGFLASQTKEVETNIRQTSRDLAEFGVSVEAARESAAALASSFGDTAIANKENLEYVSLMKQNLGVSADDSVSLMQNFMGIGGMTDKVARETAGAAASLAKAAGVPLGAVMKEVAKPSESVRSLIRGSVDALIKGAIEAKRLGTSLENVGKAAAGLLDFQSSINDEMEASVLFGKDINLTKARELSYAGDLKGLAKEQARLLKEAGDVSKMDFFQRQGIAKALGMSVEDMDKMNAKQQELNKLKVTDPALYAKYTANLETIDKTNESLSEKYQRELKSQQIASQQEKIMNSINSIMTELADAVLPILNTLVPIVGVLFKISTILIRLILAPFRLLNDAVDHFFKTFSGAKQAFDDFGNMINQFFSDVLNPKSIEGKIGLFFAGIITIGLGIWQSGTIMGMITTAITSPFKLASKLIPNYFKGSLSKVAETAVDASKKAASAAGNAVTSSIPTAGGAAPTGGASGTGGAGGGNKFVESIKGINPKTLLSLGAAMIAFAGAVYILAQAAKVFGSPEAQAGFGSMAIAAAGLAIITVALVGLSTLITTASPVLIPAIGIMLGFAASLLAVGFASKLFGEGIQLMAGVDLLSTAVGIYALSGAVLAFGASMAVGGISSFLGGGMLLQLMGLAAMGPLLLMSATSLQAIGETLEMFTNNAIADGIDTITESIKGLNKELNNMNLLNLVALASVGKGVGGGGSATNEEVVSKLDELITLMKNGGIAVNIDGTKVSTAVAVATKFRGTA